MTIDRVHSSQSAADRGAFLPSRDLPTAIRYGCHKVQERGAQAKLVSDIVAGLHGLATSLGVAQGQTLETIEVSLRTDEEAARADKSNGTFNDAEAASVDVFEAQFAKDWLTSVLSLRWLGDWEEAEEDERVASVVDQILSESSRLTSILAGQCAAGDRTSSFHFDLEDGHCRATAESQERFSITTDINETAVVEDGLGSRTWGAAPLLAAFMLRHLGNTAGQFAECLELGAGTGLVGLTIANSQAKRKGKATVHLTDFHKDVLANLHRNVAENASQWNQVSRENVELAAGMLDWSAPPANTEEAYLQAGLLRGYHCIVAADCVYEDQHTSLLKNVAEQFLIRPASGNGHAQMIVLSTIRSSSHAKDVDSIYKHFPVLPAPDDVKAERQMPCLCIVKQALIVADQADDFGPPRFHFGPAKDRREGTSKCISATIRDLPNEKIASDSLAPAYDGLYRLYIIEWR